MNSPPSEWYEQLKFTKDRIKGNRMEINVRKMKLRNETLKNLAGKVNKIGVKILLMLLLFVPFTASKSPREVEVGMALGKGSYIYNTGCSSYRVNFADFGAHVSFRDGPAHVTIQGGTVTEDRKDGKMDGGGLVLNPMVSAELQWIGIGFGGVFINSSGDDGLLPSIKLRIGSVDEVYFSAHLFDGQPFYSGGGLLRGGIGVRVTPTTAVWAGINIGPFDEFGSIINMQQEIGENVKLEFTGRLFDSEENSIAVGLSAHFPF